MDEEDESIEDFQLIALVVSLNRAAGQVVTLDKGTGIMTDHCGL